MIRNVTPSTNLHCTVSKQVMVFVLIPICCTILILSASIQIPWKGIQTKRKRKNEEKWADEKGPLRSCKLEGSDSGYHTKNCGNDSCKLPRTPSACNFVRCTGRGTIFQDHVSLDTKNRCVTFELTLCLAKSLLRPMVFIFCLSYWKKKSSVVRFFIFSFRFCSR